MRGVYRPTVQHERRARHQKNEFTESQFQSVTVSPHAYNAGRRSGSPRVESRTSGADIVHMKSLGWKCSFGLVLVLGAVMLAVVPLSAQTPSPSAAPSPTPPPPPQPDAPRTDTNEPTLA